MFNKLFASILDSSIWLQPHETRLVWITLLAAMDEDGFARFAAPENLSLRARVSLEQTNIALTYLTSPDPLSSNPDNEGRRAERVPGGWIVLNCVAYGKIASRYERRQKQAEYSRKHRQETNRVSTPSDLKSHACSRMPTPVSVSESVSASVPLVPKSVPLPNPDKEGVQGEKKELFDTIANCRNTIESLKANVQSIQVPPVTIPAALQTSGFIAQWADWQVVRRSKGKVKDWDKLFAAQLRWLEPFGEKEATEILAQSIRQGWTGLFERKHNGTQTYQRVNQRNVGTCKNPNVDYGQSAARKMAARALEIRNEQQSQAQGAGG